MTTQLIKPYYFHKSLQGIGEVEKVTYHEDWMNIFFDTSLPEDWLQHIKKILHDHNIDCTRITANEDQGILIIWY